MAASMWRMNGLWRKMAGIVLLCVLLLSNEVLCQDDAGSDPTGTPAVDPAADAGDGSAATDAAAPEAAVDPGVGTTPFAAVRQESATPAAAGGDPFPATIIPVLVDNLDGNASGTSGTTAAPTVGDNMAAPAEVPKESHILTDVMCVGQDEISSNAIKVEVATTDCEETKRIILENPEGWCQNACNLKIFQNDKTALVFSDNAKLSSLEAAFQSETVKNKLGVSNVETPAPSSSSSSNSSVFVGILVSGLLAALAITVGYFKCQRRSDPKGVRLAEEAYPVDQENQGNTLVSVAPLNPPETQEKPSVNGESTEAAKTQPPPPTNGHSTANTADTEM